MQPEYVAEVLQKLEKAKTDRIRDEASLQALEAEQARLIAEAEAEFGCRNLDELQALKEKLANEIDELVAEAERILSGEEVF